MEKVTKIDPYTQGWFDCLDWILDDHPNGISRDEVDEFKLKVLGVIDTVSRDTGDAMDSP